MNLMKEMPEHGKNFLSYIYSDKEQKHQPIMNYILAQVFSREISKIFLFIEHLWQLLLKDVTFVAYL